MSRRTLLGSSGYHPMLKEVIDYYFLYGYSWANFPTTAWLDNLNKFYYELQAGGLINALESGAARQGIFEYLYLWAIEAASVDFGRINLVRPSFPVAYGSPGFLSKNGIGNNINDLAVNFRLDDTGLNDFVRGTYVYNCNFAVWSKVGGPEAVFYTLMSASGANTRITTIRARTNPRTDCLINLTSASPQVIQNGPTQSNTIYGVTVRTSVASSTYVDSTETACSQGNTAPNNGSIIFAQSVYPGRYIGGAWAGPSMTNAQLAAMRTAITNFNSRL